ncbi:MAG: hypothetical protein AUK58_02660 [Candidatus Moranbacteria bacterium CG2_30_41_165]|nr:MAG: hypothetical protein AUK58_02660 [Candidatus Moranbacteria bacterium CG2_30_41_165]
MGRKKKEIAESEKSADDGLLWEDILHSDAKRSIVAVFLFLFSLLFFLAYFKSAGLLGEWLNTGLGLLLGFGKWLFPLLLIIAGLMFLKRRKTTLADAVKFTGLLLAFFSILGFFHLYSGENTKELLKVASLGEGGGYVGFGFAYVLMSFTGKIAGTIILMALFAIGIIASFNVSLMRFFERLQVRWSRRTGVNEDITDEKDTVASVNNLTKQTASASGDTMLSSVPSEESLDETEKKPALSPEDLAVLKKNNIQKFEFEGGAEKEEKEDDEIEEGTVLVPSYVIPKKRPGDKKPWELPPTNLMESSTGQPLSGDIDRNKEIIQSTLKHFGIDVEPGDALVGPTLTQYTFRPAFGVKLSRITALSDNLTLALSAKSIRIEAPIPGKALIGIEVPNQSVAMVRIKNAFESSEFKDRRLKLKVVLGLDVTGKIVIANLAKMPHVLIAGRTGSGKSVCMNTFLLSLLYQNSPDDMKLILIDPKRVSFSRYNGIPHLKTEVIVESKKVLNVLRWAVGEMDTRYKLLEEAGVQDIQEYQKLTAEGAKRHSTNLQTGKDRGELFPPMPYIVIMIDEMADLMVTHQKEVEPLIVRLASLARAVGIHLVLATQRPEATVITGLIKANIPARISFQLRSHIDSRTILDTSGAEKLLGNGDMLYSAADGKEMKRIQGAYVSDDEVKRVIEFWKKVKRDRGEDSIGGEIEDEKPDDDITSAMEAMDDGGEKDTLYEKAKEITIQSGRASTTAFQTTLGVGYPRAARLMRLLEDNGVVGIVDGKKTVLIGKEDITIGSAEGTETQYGDDPLLDQSDRDKWQL